MNFELKPCPFCCGKAEFDHDDNGYVWVFCKGCGVQTDTDRHYDEDCRVRLAEAWNRRALAASAPNPSDKQEAVEEEIENWRAAGRTMASEVTRLRERIKELEAAPLAQSAEQEVPMDPRLNPHGIVASPASAQSAEQDRIDAERYRFLRDKMRFSSPPGDIPTMTLSAPLEAPTHDTHKDWISDRFDASVDRTIDAAMERAND